MALAEEVPGPDDDGFVVLDIGGDVGALVLYAPAELAGAEIEISRAALPRTHALVRERRLDRQPTDDVGAAAGSGSGAGAIYAAVYPDLAAGTYTIWRDATTPAGTAVVHGGQVATWHWDASQQRAG